MIRSLSTLPKIRVFSYMMFICVLQLVRMSNARPLKMLDHHYTKQQDVSDRHSRSFQRSVQLYSRGSGLHVQITGRTVNALGLDGQEYGKLVVVSDSFGRVRFFGESSKYYLCMNLKGELVGIEPERGAELSRCVFKEEYTGRAFVEYRSVRFPKWQLAFTKTGLAKDPAKIIGGSRATQFVQRPFPVKTGSITSRRKHKTRRRRRLVGRKLKSQRKGRT